MRTLLLMVLGVCLLSMTAFAQEGEKKRKAPRLTEQGKTEMKALREDKYNTKYKAHQKFLATLSAKDQEFLAGKSAEGQVIRKERKAVEKELKALRKSGKSKEEMRDEKKKLNAPIRKKYEALMKSMQPFMERNGQAVEESIADIKAKRPEWRETKKAIIDKHGSDKRKAKMDKKDEKRGTRTGKRTDDQKAKRAERYAVRFALWNDRDKEDPFVEEE